MTKLPNGWARAPLEALIALNPKTEAPDDAKAGFSPMQMLGTRYRDGVGFEPRTWGSLRKSYVHFQDGDVLLAKITPCFENGKAGLVRDFPNGIGAGSSEYLVCRTDSRALDPRYLLALFKTEKFLRAGETRMTGSVGHKRVPKEYLLKTEVPLAPLAEQQRIADKLDALLARVDACRDRLDRVPVALKQFRRSVLWAATTGVLTEDWRSANPEQGTAANALLPVVSLPPGHTRLSKKAFRSAAIEHATFELPPSWSVRTVRDLYESNYLLEFADGNHGSLYPRREDFGPHGVRFLTASQMGEQWQLDIEGCPRLALQKANLLTKGWAKTGDVLLSHNATVGRVALLEDVAEDVLLGTSVTFYRFCPQYYSPRFARIVMSSPFVQHQLRSVMSQTTRDQVPITAQVSLNLVLAPLNEQVEIVRRVESLFALADAIEARYVAARAQVERLTPALFSKAFRGALVPQDPNDEPASALLARLRGPTGRNEAPPARKPGRRQARSSAKEATA